MSSNYKKKLPEEHWFFGAILRNKRLYTQVILASVVINVFALVSAFYIMTVYDKVIPNEAMEYLVSLTIGIVIVMSFDFILKIMRGLFTDHAGVQIDKEVSNLLFERLAKNDNVAGQKPTGAMAAIVKEFDSVKDFLGSASFIVFADLPFVFSVSLYGWWACLPDQCDNKVITCGLGVVVFSF